MISIVCAGLCWFELLEETFVLLWILCFKFKRPETVWGCKMSLIVHQHEECKGGQSLAIVFLISHIVGISAVSSKVMRWHTNKGLHRVCTHPEQQPTTVPLGVTRVRESNWCSWNLSFHHKSKGCNWNLLYYHKILSLLFQNISGVRKRAGKITADPSHPGHKLASPSHY